MTDTLLDLDCYVHALVNLVASTVFVANAFFLFRGRGRQKQKESTWSVPSLLLLTSSVVLGAGLCGSLIMILCVTREGACEPDLVPYMLRRQFWMLAIAAGVASVGYVGAVTVKCLRRAKARRSDSRAENDVSPPQPHPPTQPSGIDFLQRTAYVSGVGLLFAVLVPYWVFGFPFILLGLLLLGFIWATRPFFLNIPRPHPRRLAVLSFSLLWAVVTFFPLGQIPFHRSEKDMWKALLNQTDRLFPYEVTGPDGKVSRMSGTNSVDPATHSVRLVTNNTWEAMRKKK